MDPEKGLTSSTAQAVGTSSISSAPMKATDSANYSRLETFQYLIGTQTPSLLAQSRGSNGQRSPSSRSDNVGLYQRARDEERRSRIAYVLTGFITNILYMLQILLAATFTALSGYKDTETVTLITLGAINTVVAGILAWQKGQGVPQRYRKARDQYQALITDIEMTERTFFAFDGHGGAGASNGAELDPQAERMRLQKLFDTAKADQQANYPDLYVSTGATAAKSPDTEK
ncbi:hypothetical protein PV07_06232 [Lecanosticta acicola]|uniref:SMODS and SLOG-associating 2TM effector domain-containing protein n=1 Tax=Lecanosticta acicola TaxID=111012 RepID=A0AAI9ECY8_9PEZI|nr:hypothetical protein PV07_06232 [Lecanosticta acicola]